MPVKFATFTASESAQVAEVVRRAAALTGRDPVEIEMDLAAVHHHTPMDFERLASADPFNFMHDVSGIASHLDRTTGKLTAFFLPRYAKPRAA